MKIQNVILPRSGICSEYDLYVRLSNTHCFSSANDNLVFQSGDWAHFDTYFNGLSLSKWKKYTTVGRIKLSIRLSGAFRITLLHKTRMQDKTCTNEVLDEYEVSSSRPQSYEFVYQQNVVGGMLTFSLYSLEDDSIMYEAHYDSDVADCKRVKLGLCICTYRREQYVLKNLNTISKAIRNRYSEIFGAVEILISDNAKTLSDSEEGNVHIFKNKNVGGAGGFTRCLIEALNHNDEFNLTHVVMMDDDIVFDFESIFRTYSFLSAIKDEYVGSVVAGAMLRGDRQYIQTESGALWNRGNLISLKGGLNLSSCEACLFNEIEETCDYAAWWYCTIPIDVVRYDNLPLPIFIRGDDVEYGLRNGKRVITLNGICVWHEPFENKYSSSMYYYIFRNRLIDNSVRSIPYPLSDLRKDLYRLWKEEVLKYRYKNAMLLLRGVDDYLNGIEWLKQQDGELLHKEIMASGYSMRPVEELDYVFTFGDFERSCGASVTNKVLSLATFNGSMLRANRDVIVPVYTATVDKFFRARRALNYDYSTGRGFITQRDWKYALGLLLKLGRTMRRLSKLYKSVYEEYCVDKDTLTDIAFWKQYLELDGETN